MNSLSISFTLGKQSSNHGANVEHNNRDFIATNVKLSEVHTNIKYVQESPEKSYQKLFETAVKEYNEKQKQPCRRIKDYYSHILKSKREEAFYESIIQFGDKDTAGCKSKTGEKAKEMLDEYMKEFQHRNPNLYVFNATLHQDEATPHLHINFIPFYTKGRTNGLSKGVSLKAALDEQGFSAKNYKENRLVAWEESERTELEKILNKYGFEKENKNVKHTHMDVHDYKRLKEVDNIRNAISKTKRPTIDYDQDNLTKLKEKIKSIEYENKKLSAINGSEYRPMYYSSPEKLSYVQAELDKQKIKYIETETGFEIKDYYIDLVRKIEKSYKPTRSPARDKLRTDIDRLIMASLNFDDFLTKLENENYKIKHGKYISVLPEHGEKYIRLKSLGEFYNELALQNRITANQNFEKQYSEKFKNVSADNDLERMTLKTINVYFIAIKRGMLSPAKKKNIKRPFAWTNDTEIDKLTLLNSKINSCSTLESLKKDFEMSEEKVNSILNKVDTVKDNLRFFTNIKNHIDIVFEGKSADPLKIAESKKLLSSYKDITINQDNYKNIDILISNETSDLKKLNSELKLAQTNLKKNSDFFEFAQKVAGGTYVQSLIHDEKIRNVADFIPKGFIVK